MTIKKLRRRIGFWILGWRMDGANRHRKNQLDDCRWNVERIAFVHARARAHYWMGE